jgi:hypothetical protein
MVGSVHQGHGLRGLDKQQRRLAADPGIVGSVHWVTDYVHGLDTQQRRAIL